MKEKQINLLGINAKVAVWRRGLTSSSPTFRDVLPCSHVVVDCSLNLLLFYYKVVSDTGFLNVGHVACN